MPTVNTSQFKRGLKVEIEGEPYAMIEMDFTKPGKGQAVYRTKLKNLINGRMLDRSYKNGETLELADVDERSVQYLYQDGTYFHFMNPDNYEQYEVPAAQLGDLGKFLVEEATCDVIFWNGTPISVTPPAHVDLKVTYTEPGAKGNSTGNVQKPATLHTGAEIMVPIFVNVDDVVRVDTRTGEYVERVTKS